MEKKIQRETVGSEERKRKDYDEKINDVTVYKRHRIASRCILYYIIILYSRRFFATTINLSTVRSLPRVHILLLYIVAAAAVVPGKHAILVSFFFFIFTLARKISSIFRTPNTAGI